VAVARAQTIAVLRALPGLGDLLCAVPALRALRGALPAARVSVIGLPISRLLLERFGGYVDELLEFPGYPGMPEGCWEPARLGAFLAEMRARRFDLAIQLHGSGEQSNELVALLGARATAGYCRSGPCPLDREHTLQFCDDEPEPVRNLRLVAQLGGSGEPDLEFPVRATDRRACAALLGTSRTAGLAVVHPGASRAENRWPAERFAAVADGLAARGLRVALTGGDAERELTGDVARRMRAPALDLAGSTDVGTLAALLETATLLVCNDTGISHLAAALATPSVVLLTAPDDTRWAPLDRHRHRPLARTSTVDEALATADDLLGRAA
jgi:ADP-heptose:LPS heptosyltransferase